MKPWSAFAYHREAFGTSNEDHTRTRSVGRWVRVCLLFVASCTCGREISGSEIPICPSSGPCDAPVFDADAGKCVDALAADGTVCDAGLVCQVDTRCVAGVCLGTPVTCDDANACTQDTCLEGEGCQHTPVNCQGDNPCQTYGCNPASGCDVTGAVADGTACQLWWEPCVDDAVCTAGTCDSPTADAESSGQVRWQTPLGGPFGALGPFTVDDAGTSTFLAARDGGTDYEMVAIDACGNVLWSTNTGLDIFEVLQDDRQLVAVAGDGATHAFLMGLDPATGGARWSVDLFAQAGLDAGPCVNTDGPAIAESNSGSIEALIDACGVSLVMSLSGEAQIAWKRQEPFVRPFNWGQVNDALALDANGDAFAVGLSAARCGDVMTLTAVLSGISLSGESVLQVALPNESPPGECDTPSTMSPMASAGALILTAQQGPGFVVAFDGGIAATLPPLSFGNGGRIFLSTPVQDSDGNLFIPGILTDAGISGVTAFSESGSVLWTSTAITAGSLLLSDDGLVFGSQIDESGLSAGIVAIDTVTGASTLTAAIPAPILSLPRVALTPGASLLTANQGGAVAIFAGKHRPSTTASWSRWGGDNSNRSSAR